MPMLGDWIRLSFLVLCCFSVTSAQKAGTLEKEGAPKMTFLECTNADGCKRRQAKMALDANWRWVHSSSGYDNCYEGNSWADQYCPDGKTCAQNCVLEGVTSEQYKTTYGIEEIEDGVKLGFVTEHEYGTNVGSRLYMLDPDNEDQYKMFYLKNREFSMDFDVSELQCGMNGAMYFIEMDKTGDKGGGNQAGAKYGTGYCDAQCPHDIKFINGEANLPWKPNPKDKSKNMGIGKYGTCCPEMDIWEANSMATAYTPHPCTLDRQMRCEGIACGDNDKGERYKGVCDKDGCDINPFRMGNQTFYGRGPQFDVDTTKPMTVVTQFWTDDCTDKGVLSEIRRFYIQDGKLIHSPPTVIMGENQSETIHDKFCYDKKVLFKDYNDFQRHGGNKGMGESLDRGHVMAVSLWDDVEVNMLWLDSKYPLGFPDDYPGIKRGACPGDKNSPEYVRKNFPNAWTSFRNAAVGEIGSTQNRQAAGPPPPPPPPTCTGPPECTGKDKATCEQLAREGKCSWVAPTPAPPTPPPPPAPPLPPLPKCVPSKIHPSPVPPPSPVTRVPPPTPSPPTPPPTPPTPAPSRRRSATRRRRRRSTRRRSTRRRSTRRRRRRSTRRRSSRRRA